MYFYKLLQICKDKDAKVQKWESVAPIKGYVRMFCWNSIYSCYIMVDVDLKSTCYSTLIFFYILFKSFLFLKLFKERRQATFPSFLCVLFLPAHMIMTLV